MDEKKIKKYISSTVSYHDFEEACKLAKDLNLGIEISRFGRLKDIEQNYEANLEDYREILDEYKLDVSLHGFFSNLNIASKDPLIASVSKKRYDQSLELATVLGAKTVVFHTCYNNLLMHKQYQQMFFLKNIEFYNDYLEAFEEQGIVATIENVHEPDAEFIRNLIAAVNSPNLKATLDIGHCNLHSTLEPSEWIREYVIMLHHLHIHNNFADEDSHSSLLKGSVNIRKIIETLHELQLYPSFTFEIFNKNELIESIEHFDKICAQVGYGVEN